MQMGGIAYVLHVDTRLAVREDICIYTIATHHGMKWRENEVTGGKGEKPYV